VEKSGMLQVQYHDIKQGSRPSRLARHGYQTVLTRAEFKTGEPDLSVREGEVGHGTLRRAASLLR
jgi:hypothetical protein